jgi:O-acetyl-ADP-ribose deacetylase (regulator of RNase III)
MKYFIKECLLNAKKKNYESISFPILGSGALEFPPDCVAKFMSEVLDDFELEHPSTSLKTVRIVMHSNEETVNIMDPILIAFDFLKFCQ